VGITLAYAFLDFMSVEEVALKAIAFLLFLPVPVSLKSLFCMDFVFLFVGICLPIFQVEFISLYYLISHFLNALDN